jgi:hypothetical protein
VPPFKETRTAECGYDKRVAKVLNFWRKKYKAPKLPKMNKRKQKVANNKLRIKGKFVTVEQAIKLIGKR